MYIFLHAVVATCVGIGLYGFAPRGGLVRLGTVMLSLCVCRDFKTLWCVVLSCIKWGTYLGVSLWSKALAKVNEVEAKSELGTIT